MKYLIQGYDIFNIRLYDIIKGLYDILNILL